MESQPKQYDWAQYQAVFDAAREIGLRVKVRSLLREGAVICRQQLPPRCWLHCAVAAGDRLLGAFTPYNSLWSCPQDSFEIRVNLAGMWALCSSAKKTRFLGCRCHSASTAMTSTRCRSGCCKKGRSPQTCSSQIVLGCATQSACRLGWTMVRTWHLQGSAAEWQDSNRAGCRQHHGWQQLLSLCVETVNPLHSASWCSRQ